MKKRLLGQLAILLATYLLTSGLSAQNLEIRVSSKSISLGEQLRVQYVSNGQLQNFQHGTFTGFDILAGPSQSSSFRNINGKTSAEIAVGFVLQPKAEGSFTLPKATATIDGKKVGSNQVTIEVLPMSEANKRKEQEIRDKVYVKVELSRNSCYQGEAVLATYKFYTAYNLAGVNIKELPSINGCWSKDVLEKEEQTFKLVTENGVRYNMATVLKQLIIPQSSGKIELPPAKIEVGVQVPTGRRTFFGNETVTKSMTIASPRRVLQVKALPAKGKPADFNGAVGSFNINNVLNSDTADVNEAISLNQTLKGKGNLSLFPIPALRTPQDVELFEPKENDKISASATGMRGTKEVQNVLIPRHAGTYKLSTPAFSYFDPAQAKYITLPAEEFSLVVRGGSSNNQGLTNSSSSDPIAGQVTKQKVGRLSNDILEIEEKTSLKAVSKPLLRSAAFKWLWWLPVLLGWLLFVTSRALSNREVDVVGQRQKKAKSVAVKVLKEVATNQNNASDKEFYGQISKAVKQFLLQKLNLQMSDMTESEINDHLTSRSVNQETITGLKSFFDSCHMATYGLGDAGNRDEIMKKAEQLINQLESQL